MVNASRSDSHLSLLVECEECQDKFSVPSESAIRKKEFQLNGQSIFLTYYDCPKCNKRHFVQIDDAKSMDLLKTNERQFVYIAALKRKGKKVKDKKVDQYKNAHKHLASYRRKLMEEFAGKELYDEEKQSKFELRFSV